MGALINNTLVDNIQNGRHSVVRIIGSHDDGNIKHLSKIFARIFRYISQYSENKITGRSIKMLIQSQTFSKNPLYIHTEQKHTT